MLDDLSKAMLVLTMLTAAACSDGGSDEPAGGSGSPAGGASDRAGSGAGGGSPVVSGGTAPVGGAGAGAGGGGGSASPGGAPATGGGGQAGGGAGGAGGGGAASSGLDAPDNEQELVAFLDAKQYLGWAKEAEYHASTGPHGDAVRVYYSPIAALALTSGAATFPMGAASVKELTSGGSLYGWAVWVKVQDATESGHGFFWYEVIRQGPGKQTVYGNARGSDDCVGCHSGGKDYDLSTLPFQ